MDDVAQILSLVLAAGVGIGIPLLAYYKLKPGERERVDVDVAEGNINVAQGTLNVAQATIDLTQSFDERFRAMSDQMSSMRAEHEQFRRDTDAVIAELKVELRAERAEKAKVTRENEDLKARVASLEAEVARLKAGG